MIFSKWNVLLLSLVLALSVPAESIPQKEPPPPGYRIHRSIPPQGAKTHVVVPGGRFRAGWLKRWIHGSDYRDLWTTPIEVAVLDLDSVGGGLTPLRTGGFGQSISLHFTGEDGRRYTVRSLDKDPTKRIWDQLKGTIADGLPSGHDQCASADRSPRGRSAHGSHRYPPFQAYTCCYPG